MPNLPALTGAVIDYDVRDWYGMFVPAGMTGELVAKISGDVLKVLAMPDIKK